MEILKGTQTIGQLEKRKGGYFYLQVDRSIIEKLPAKRNTRIICNLEGKLAFRCGFNHLGDGNFFIILSNANLNKIGKTLGSKLTFVLTEDPDPLGVEVPEVLATLLEQDPALNIKFDKLSLGKKRNIIHQVSRVKNLDGQVAKSLELISTAGKPRQR